MFCECDVNAMWKEIVWLKMDLHDEHETHDTFSCCEQEVSKQASKKKKIFVN